MRARTREATPRGTANATVRKTNGTGVIPTFTGALRVTDMVATLRHGRDKQ